MAKSTRLHVAARRHRVCGRPALARRDEREHGSSEAQLAIRTQTPRNCFLARSTSFLHG